MTAFPALRPLRIGCVRYLNSRPLIHAYDGNVLFDHPSGLARELAAGRLDAALVPVFEALREPGCRIVDGVAVACDGPVFSVFLAHRAPLRELRRIALDPASLTSVHLLKVLLAEFHHLAPDYVATDPDAQLLIGNQAIDFRLSAPAGWHFLDLGEEWRRCTSLPFPFAVWTLRAAIENAAAVAQTFRELKTAGLARLGEIIDTDPFRDREFRTRYLTEHIRFDLGQAEKRGLAEYRRLLIKHGHLAADACEPVFV